MIEVHPNLFVGSEEDYLQYLNSHPSEEGLAVVHACKDPYHRERLGYSTRGAPRSLGDAFFFLEDENVNGNMCELYLNIIDADNPNFIPKVLFTKSYDFINRHIKDRKVLIHCNRGESRSAGIAMSYLYLFTDIFKGCRTHGDLIEEFKQLYPYTKMGRGITM